MARELRRRESRGHGARGTDALAAVRRPRPARLDAHDLAGAGVELRLQAGRAGACAAGLDLNDAAAELAHRQHLRAQQRRRGQKEEGEHDGEEEDRLGQQRETGERAEHLHRQTS